MPKTDDGRPKVAPESAVVFDVTGQPGGPSPEEQARVDEEQRQLIEKIKKARAENEAADVVQAAENQRRAQEAIRKRTEREAQIDQLIADVGQIKAKLGIA